MKKESNKLTNKDDLITKKLKRKMTKPEQAKRNNDLVQLKKFYKKTPINKKNWVYEYYKSYEDVRKVDNYIVGFEQEQNLFYRFDYVFKEEVKKYFISNGKLSSKLKKYLQNKELFTQYFYFLNFTNEYGSNRNNGIHQIQLYFLDDVKKVINLLPESQKIKQIQMLERKGYYLNNDPIPF